MGKRAAANLEGMIQDVDESLRALVKKEALNGSKAEVAFDAPTRDWSARRNTPTVDLYLYDIREDLERREMAWEEVRDEKGIITGRRPRPRRFKLSYLVTAWTQRPEDEHRLLSSLLACFVRHEVMPAELVTGSLTNPQEPIYLTIALPPPQDRSISDVWSALGGELKPSLDLVVNAPVDLRISTPAAPLVREEPRISMVAPGAGAEPPPVPARGKGKRPADVKPAETSPGSAGPAGPKGGGRLARGEPASPAAPAVQDEMVRSGKERQPGRILRLHGIPRE